MSFTFATHCVIHPQVWPSDAAHTVCLVTVGMTFQRATTRVLPLTSLRAMRRRLLKAAAATRFGRRGGRWLLLLKDLLKGPEGLGEGLPLGGPRPGSGACCRTWRSWSSEEGRGRGGGRVEGAWLSESEGLWGASVWLLNKYTNGLRSCHVLAGVATGRGGCVVCVREMIKWMG